jgi:hypothetical protein
MNPQPAIRKAVLRLRRLAEYVLCDAVFLGVSAPQVSVRPVVHRLWQVAGSLNLSVK